MSSGGIQNAPVWTGGRDAIIYLDPDGRFVRHSADFKGSQIVLGEPFLLFEGRTWTEIFGQSAFWAEQHPTNGQWLTLQTDLSWAQRLEVVSNWAAGLE